jgi:transposase
MGSMRQQSEQNKERAMSLQPQAIPATPEETIRVARAAFAKGNRYMRMRDELGVFYQDDEFAGLYAQRGQPDENP